MNIPTHEYKVYLDKFTTFPPIPKKKSNVTIPLNLGHCTIRSKLEEDENAQERATFPSGRIAPKFLQQTKQTFRSNSRKVCKVDSIKNFGITKESPYLEGQLAFLQNRQIKYNELCQRQIQKELIHFDSNASNSSMDDSKSCTSCTSINDGRKRRIYNQNTLIQCMIETTPMPLISQKTVEKLSAYDVVPNAKSLTSFESRHSNDNWDDESVESRLFKK